MRAGRKRKQVLTPALVKAVTQIAKKSTFRIAEKRLKTTNIDTTAITTGNYTDLTSIAQGDAYYNRDGHQVRIIDIRLTLEALVNPTATYNCYRIMVFRWIVDNNADAPADADIFEDTANEVWLSPPKFEARQFQILYDKIGTLEDGATSTGRVHDVTLRQSLKTPVGYTGGANTGVNHIYLLLIADEAVNGPTIHGHASVRFIDV